MRVQDGRVVHVRGDPDHPVSRGKLCRKCTLAYNNVFLDPAARLTDPLVRRGPKGAGHFEPVSWEEALEVVAARLGAIAAEDATRIVYSHYTGSFSLLSYFFPMRLMRRLGATEVAPVPPCCGSARASSASRTGAMSCAASPPFRPSPATSAGRERASCI